MTDTEAVRGAKIERIVLEVEPGMVVPVIVLTPVKLAKRAPVVVGLGKRARQVS